MHEKLEFWSFKNMVDWSEIEALQAELAAACNEDVAQRLSGF